MLILFIFSTSEERQARSPSTDKRSRHKVKKRFSPSPVAKKRKLMPIATPTPTTSKKSSKKKNSTVANEEQFGEGLRDYGDKISLESHTDFDIPNEWKTGTSSETVEQTMVESEFFFLLCACVYSNYIVCPTSFRKS